MIDVKSIIDAGTRKVSEAQSIFKATPSLQSMVPKEFSSSPIQAKIAAIANETGVPVGTSITLKNPFKQDKNMMCYPTDATLHPYVQFMIVVSKSSQAMKGATGGTEVPDGSLLSGMSSKAVNGLNDITSGKAGQRLDARDMTEKAQAKAKERASKNPQEEVNVKDKTKTTDEAKQDGIISQFNRAKYQLKESIVLPMPNTFTSPSTSKWKEAGMGLIAGMLLDPNAGQTMGAMNKEGAQKVMEAVNQGASFAARAAVDAFQAGAGDVATGIAANPFLNQMFDGVSLRKFQFSWKVSARNKQEADMIREIIYTFRYHAAPEFEGSFKAFMRYPSEFEIGFFIGNGKENTSLPKIARCVCSNFDVKFNEGEQWNYFNHEDFQPTHITINAEFSEVNQIVTKEFVEKGF